MPYNLQIATKDDVLWVTATGTRDYSTVLSMSKDIMAACVEQRVKKVLTDVRALEGRLSATDSFDIVTQRFPAMRDPSVITHNAIVDLKEFAGSYRFFENVAVNRGFRLRIFSDAAEALVWLKE